MRRVPLRRLVRGLLFLAMGWLPLAPAAAADRPLLKYENVQALVRDDSSWCAAQVDVQLRGSAPEDFRDDGERLQKLLGGLRAALGFECPEAQAISLAGFVGNDRVFSAVSAAANDWRLDIYQLPAAEVVPPAAVAVPAPPAGLPEVRSPGPDPAAASQVLPVTPPVGESTAAGPASLGWLWWLVLGAGVAMAFVLKRRGLMPALRMPALKLPRVALPARKPRQPQARPLPPAPAPAPAAAPAPAPVPSQPATPPPVTPMAAPLPEPEPEPAIVPAGVSLKDQLLAQQKAKYQSRYTAAMDELTATQMELQAAAGVPDTLVKDLRRILGSVQKSARELIRERYRDNRKALLNAALLLAPYRVWKRFPVGWRVIAGLGIGYLLLMAAQLLMGGKLFVVLAAYALLLGALFLYERQAMVKGALVALDKCTTNLRSANFSYVYRDQAPQGQAGAVPTLQGLKIRIETGRPPQEEFSIAMDAPLKPEGGLVVLAIPDMGQYGVDDSGATRLGHWNTGHAFMASYGQILTDALAAHAPDLANAVQSVRGFGDLKWRERRQREELPRLQALLDNIARLEDIWRDVWVDNKAFEFLLRRLDLFNLRDSATPPGLLLHGYPGNGKQFLARKVAESVFATFDSVSLADMNTAKDVKELWQRSRSSPPLVLFVDYADQAFPKPGSSDGGSGARENTLAWIEEWTRATPAQSGVWVIMTAQSDQALHPRVLSVFGGSRIEIGSPDRDGRLLILRAACAENQLPTRVPQWLVDSTAGATVTELRELVKETKLHCFPEPPTDNHWRAGFQAVRGAGGGLQDSTKTWERLVLPEDVKAQLKNATRILREADRYVEKGAPVPNVLLFGPPGTGKTEIARTFANEGGVKFIAAATADLKGQYLGQSAHLVRDLFARARASAPCVLFIDEIESVVPARAGSGADQLTNEIVTQILQEMDGVKKSARPILVLAATNIPEAVDKACLSRFTRKIEIPLPDEEGRREILKRLLAEKPLAPGLEVDEICALLARKTPKKSGRDLKMLVDRAMEAAVLDAESPDHLQLTREVLLAEAVPQGKVLSPERLQAIWAKIVLKPDVKDAILTRIRLFNQADKKAPRGLLLYGPPGTGKSEIARLIAESATCKFMSLKGPDLKAGYLGQSGQNVKQIWETARQSGRCVIFIDECEGVFARRGSTSSDALSDETVQAFLAEWDGVGSEGQQIWVVGATNRRELLDDAVVSRFGSAVEIGAPGPEERLQILRLELDKLEYQDEVPAFVGQATTGYSGRNLATLARDVGALADERGGSVTPEIWREVIARNAKSSSDAVDETARWDSLILADETLARLREVCDSLRDIEVLRKQGYKPPAGALLFGPPGTGKTQIARTLANESGLPFIAAGTADLKAGFLGQSGKMVKELFERARGKAPCILFIDEIEAVVPNRTGSGADQYTNEIVNQLLGELDGVRKSDRHVFLLAATNLPETVDPAIRSRFDFKIEVPLPDADQRRRLFEVFLAKYTCDVDKAELAGELARLAGRIGGRDIVKLVERATQRAVSRARAAGTMDKIVLTRADLLAEVAPQDRELPEDKLAEIWSKIVLSPDIKDSLRSKIRLFSRGDKAAPRGLLLYGPPGTGKTEIARLIAQSAGCHFMGLSGPDLKAGFVGQSGQKVRKTWEEARGRGRTVIFVDECEGVFARRGSTNSDAGSDEMVQAFLAEWDGMGSEGQQVWVVGATNRRDLLDDAIVSRFGAAIEIGPPGPAERLEILRLEMGKLERTVEIPAFVAQATTGFSGRNLAFLAREVCALATERGGAITDDLWREVVAKRSAAASDGVQKDARWDSLVLPEGVLQKFRTICDQLRHLDTLREQGIEPPKGALLFGPPGTGKTQIARTLANESGVTFLSATLADLKAGFVGQSGQKVKEIFDRARGQAPCILFIDELDAVAPTRGGPGSDQFTIDMVNQMLTELEGVKASDRPIYLLAATNLPDAVDPAILSRFDDRIEIPLPDPAQRQQLLRIFIGRRKVDFDVDELAAAIAPRTSDMGGRDLRKLVDRATQKAVGRALKAGTPGNVVLTRDDVLDALGGTKGAGTG